MQPFGWTSGAWLLALTLGLWVASCATYAGSQRTVSFAIQPPAPDLRSLTSKKSDAITKAKLQVAYARLPLHFEPNQGQTDEQVHFLSRGSGYTFFLTSTEAVLALHNPPPKAGHKTEILPTAADAVTSDFGLWAPDPGLVLHMQLVGANPNPQVAGLEELPGKADYFIGNDPTKWRTNIPTYARVAYREVYSGVNLVYYGNQRQLEYDLVVAPGADPSVIRLAFQDRAGHPLPLQIDGNGDLLLRTAGGEVRLLKPRIYQEINGIKQSISGRYVLLQYETQNSGLGTPDPGLCTQNSGLSEVGFQVAAYDTSKPLIIDPVLSYSTYLGGNDIDIGLGIAVDSSGNAYVTGETWSPDFPVANPLQPAIKDIDAFVAKLSPAGSALVYSTYLGGSEYGTGLSIAVDTTGNAYVTGKTISPDFPTANPFQPTYSDDTCGDLFLPCEDAFVTKLNPAGSALVYSTYLGGNSDDEGFSIAVDAAGNAYVTGKTVSTDFPTANPFQPAYGGGAGRCGDKVRACGGDAQGHM